MSFFFFFNDTATTEIYTLSLHDALPICSSPGQVGSPERGPDDGGGEDTRWWPSVSGSRCCAPWPRTSHFCAATAAPADRKSTRLNSSHLVISYAVFCLKKKTYSAY